jgi:hypothetical protein
MVYPTNSAYSSTHGIRVEAGYWKVKGKNSNRCRAAHNLDYQYSRSVLMNPLRTIAVVATRLLRLAEYSGNYKSADPQAEACAT